MNARARARILLVDDEPSQRRNLARALVRDFDVLTAEDGPAALGLLATTRVEAVLLDLAMPRMSGAEVLEQIKAAHPDVEVVVMAGHAELDAAVAAVRAGAYAFVTKPVEPEAALSIAVERAIERRRLEARARALEERVGEHEQLGEVIASSAAMQDAYRRALGVASVAAPLLLVGERGTGKELVARAVHRRGPRAGRRFVAVDCSALPAPRAEEELFGEGRGASPDGGVGGGLIDAADGGTLFLDEVSALPLAAQARLLRVLTHGEVAGAGAAGAAGEPRRADVRVIASTCADLRARAAAGEFREDLLYRLGVIVIELPPLRRRREDIALLASHFLQRCARRHGRGVARIGPEAARLLREHAWPGNVGELESAIEHAVLSARGDAILPVDLPPAVSGRAGPDRRPPRDALVLPAQLCELPYAEAKERAIEAFDRIYIGRLLQRTGNNLSEAARQAGMDRSNFRRLKKKVASRGDEAAVGDAAGEGEGPGEGDGAGEGEGPEEGEGPGEGDVDGAEAAAPPRRGGAA
ncbi:sigma-54 dependent transcriptional regulator [Sorangium sp. So ce834]|uniref:sigma-54-dependent transcriptional regulator n=1 Tax=Sorangium sp. So ce834 TaxID=3133321 RepID=UPI003F607741